MPENGIHEPPRAISASVRRRWTSMLTEIATRNGPRSLPRKMVLDMPTYRERYVSGADRGARSPIHDDLAVISG